MDKLIPDYSVENNYIDHIDNKDSPILNIL